MVDETYNDEILFRAVSVDGTTKVVEKLIKELNLTMNAAWTKSSKRAIKAAVAEMAGSDNTVVGFRRLLERMKQEMGKVTNVRFGRLTRSLIGGAYKVVKSAFSGKFQTDAVIRRLDTASIQSMAKEGPYWLNRLYARQLSDRIREIGFRTMVQGGLGVETGAKVMRGILTKELSLVGGPTALESVAPAKYSGNIAEYSRILTSNVANRVRNFSGLSAMNDAGLERYQIAAVRDRRTSEICIEMDGRIFTVNSGVGLMNRMNDAETPEELKAIHPWVDASAARTIAGTGSLGQQSENLAGAGLAIPPYHGRCRTVVQALTT